MVATRGLRTGSRNSSWCTVRARKHKRMGREGTPRQLMIELTRE